MNIKQLEAMQGILKLSLRANEGKILKRSEKNLTEYSEAILQRVKTVGLSCVGLLQKRSLLRSLAFFRNDSSPQIGQAFLFFLLFTFGITSLFAQSQKDFAVLGQVAIQKKVTSDFAVNLAFQSIINENVTEMRNFYTTLGLEYRLFKNWSVVTAYRFSFNRGLDNLYQNRQRWMFDLNYGGKLAKKVGITWRSRVQQQMYGLSFDDDNNYKRSRIYWRNRVGLQYALNWYWKIGAGVEVFYPLNQPDVRYIDQIRLQTDVSYRLNRHHSYKLLYQIRQPLDSAPATTFFILGAAYSFKF
ncbi:MAG: DUF2490 domain-containing protein [Bacteroidia bacterium]